MSSLNATDLGAVLAQVQRLHEEPNLAHFPRTLLSCLQALVPCDVAAYEEINPQRQRTVGETDPPSARPNPQAIAVWEKHLPEHPVIQRFAGTDDRRAQAISDHLSRRQFARTGIFNEFYRALGLEDQLGLFVAAPKPLMIAVGLSRSGWGFKMREREILDLLQPHILQAYRNAEAMTDLAAGGGWAIDALEAGANGVILLDADTDVLASTVQARQWLLAYYPRFTRRTSGLPAPLAQWVKRAKENYRARNPQDLAVSENVTHHVIGEHGQLNLRLIPARRTDGYLLLLQETPNVPIPATANPLRSEARRLPPRHRRTLQALLTGLSEKEIAARLGLSAHSLHQYVKEIYANLGVCSRAELMAGWHSPGS